MKLTTVLISVLVALNDAGIASAEVAEPVISLPPDAPSEVFDHLEVNEVPTFKLLKLRRCLQKNKGYVVDWSEEGQGIFSITSLNTGCCHQAEGLWQENRDEMDSIGTPVFLSPCTGFTVSNVSPKNMRMVKRLIPHS